MTERDWADEASDKVFGISEYARPNVAAALRAAYNRGVEDCFVVIRDRLIPEGK